jgi:DNA-binding MarR family transcriptional regulator
MKTKENKEKYPADQASLAEEMADLTFALLERCQEKEERIAGNIGLTVSEFKVLRQFRSDSELSAGELARRTEVSSSRLTRILDGLEEDGVILRHLASGDRRVMEVALTEKGRRIQTDLRRWYIQTHEDILDLLPVGTGESVIFALRKLNQAIQEWANEQ